MGPGLTRCPWLLGLGPLGLRFTRLVSYIPRFGFGSSLEPSLEPSLDPVQVVDSGNANFDPLETCPKDSSRGKIIL